MTSRHENNVIEKLIVINHTGFVTMLKHNIDLFILNNHEYFGTHTKDLNDTLLIDMISYCIQKIMRDNGYIVTVTYYQDWPNQVNMFFKEILDINIKIFYNIMRDIVPNEQVKNFKLMLVPFMNNIHFYIKAERVR